MVRAGLGSHRLSSLGDKLMPVFRDVHGRLYRIPAAQLQAFAIEPDGTERLVGAEVAPSAPVSGPENKSTESLTSGKVSASGYLWQSEDQAPIQASGYVWGSEDEAPVQASGYVWGSEGHAPLQASGYIWQSGAEASTNAHGPWCTGALARRSVQGAQGPGLVC